MPVELSTLGSTIRTSLEGLPEAEQIPIDAVHLLPEALAARDLSLTYAAVNGSRTLALADNGKALDLLDASAVLTIPDEASVPLPAGFRVLVRWRDGGQVVAPGAAALHGATGDAIAIDAPVASEIKACWLFRTAADVWWAMPTAGDADVAALYSAVAANTAALAGKAPLSHTHTIDDLSDVGAEVALFLAASDAAAARATLSLARKLSKVAEAGETITVSAAAHAEQIIEATGAAPAVTFDLQATASYPELMSGAIFFENGGTVSIASGGMINGELDPDPVAIGPYGMVGYWRRGDNDFVVGYPGSGGGGGGGTYGIADIIGLPEALAARYSDANSVATALEARSAESRFTTLDAHFEALKATSGLVRTNGAGQQIGVEVPTIQPSLTYQVLMSGDTDGYAVRPDVLIDPFPFREVNGAGGAQTIDPAVIGGPNIRILSSSATELITLKATPDPFLYVIFENVGGGARDVTLVSSGASGFLTIEFAQGVDNTLNLGSTAGNLIGFHLTKDKPDHAVVTGIWRK